MSLYVTKRPAEKRRMLLKDRLPDELHQNARGQHRKIRGEALDPREVPEELPRELRLRGTVHPPPTRRSVCDSHYHFFCSFVS